MTTYEFFEGLIGLGVVVLTLLTLINIARGD